MKKPTLVVKQLLPRLGRVFGIGALDDGVHGARLLAEAAVDALCHVDVVARRPAGPVGALLGLDGDGLRRADGLAKLAGDAALLAAGVPPQGVLAAEPGRDGALFEGVIDRVPVETDPPTSARSQSTSRRTSLPPPPVASQRKRIGGITHGGLKNCSSITCIPRTSSSKRKYLPSLSNVGSSSSSHFLGGGCRNPFGGGPRGVA